MPTLAPRPPRWVRPRSGHAPAAGPAAPAVVGDELHLLRRVTYGVTPALLDDVRAAGGAGAWLEQQLAPDRLADPVCDATLARFPLAQATPQQMHTLGNGTWEGMDALQRATFSRACWSRRQLLEVMVELWSDHLNVTCPSSEVWDVRPAYDLVLRAHALGRFEDLLLAVGRSPGMLRYLDGASSRGSAPNENWARELLELHTVGRAYSQADVLGAARALAGRSVWEPWDGATPDVVGTFRWRPEWHPVGPLQVLGWTHPNSSTGDGLAVGDSLLSHLAQHPGTAARVARRLAVRFVSDDPPAALVDRLAGVYLAAGTAVVPVLRTLFASPEFAASVGAKTRRPYEDVVATVRTVGLVPDPAGAVRGIADWVWQLRELGHDPGGWPGPDGYPDVAPAWAGTGSVLGRWNLHLAATQHWFHEGIAAPGSLADRLLPGPVPATRDELVAALGQRLLGGPGLPGPHRDALVSWLGGPGRVGRGDTQWDLPVLAALVLDAPAWSVR